MMTETMMMFVLTSIVGLISAIFWRWVSSISKINDQTTNKIDALKQEMHQLKAELYRGYQSKPDAHRDVETIVEMLRDIKKDVATLSGKIDNKADK